MVKAKKYKAFGQEKTMRQWSESANVSLSTLKSRIAMGYDMETAISMHKYGFRARIVTAFGRTQTLSDWARESGLSVQALCHRLDKLGYNPEEALSIPAGTRIKSKRRTAKNYEAFGEEKTLKEWAEEYAINPDTVSSRLKHGWSLEKALMTPISRHSNGRAKFTEKEKRRYEVMRRYA